MKQIPNIFTLLNLFFGCIAIVYAVQPGLVPLYQDAGNFLTPEVNEAGIQYLSIPQNICIASLFIGMAALIDFLDGFIARLMHASSDMGKQLDSLADVVSFGVAPAMIVFEFLRMSFAQKDGGLSTSFLFFIPAFILPCAGAFRLARYNLDTTLHVGFKGLPIPAAGILIASFPLLFWYNSNTEWVIPFITNYWFWYILIIFISYLMISKLPMLSLKINKKSRGTFIPLAILLIFGVLMAIFFGWLAVPLTFVAYLIISLLYKQSIS
ncbi:MAG: CDP-alcohol phosphatidyltransferase family protein [Bacteroidetes bacterium]|nr:CDP-alcohol phosphatidyltransferase family protein [Bacteroidota bacterium]